MDPSPLLASLLTCLLFTALLSPLCTWAALAFLQCLVIVLPLPQDLTRCWALAGMHVTTHLPHSLACPSDSSRSTTSSRQAALPPLPRRNPTAGPCLFLPSVRVVCPLLCVMHYCHCPHQTPLSDRAQAMNMVARFMVPSSTTTICGILKGTHGSSL